VVSSGSQFGIAGLFLCSRYRRNSATSRPSRIVNLLGYTSTIRHGMIRCVIHVIVVKQIPASSRDGGKTSSCGVAFDSRATATVSQNASTKPKLILNDENTFVVFYFLILQEVRGYLEVLLRCEATRTNQCNKSLNDVGYKARSPE
jgi:hypothetical protein